VNPVTVTKFAPVAIFDPVESQFLIQELERISMKSSFLSVLHRVLKPVTARLEKLLFKLTGLEEIHSIYVGTVVVHLNRGSAPSTQAMVSWLSILWYRYVP
jgi:hypothetical protein